MELQTQRDTVLSSFSSYCHLNLLLLKKCHLNNPLLSIIIITIKTAYSQQSRSLSESISQGENQHSFIHLDYVATEMMRLEKMLAVEVPQKLFQLYI